MMYLFAPDAEKNIIKLGIGKGGKANETY